METSLKQSWYNIVSTWCNVVSTLFQRLVLTLYQLCSTLKIRRWILFHFQLWINVISTLIHIVETTLIRWWNVGWVIIFKYGLKGGWYLQKQSKIITFKDQNNKTKIKEKNKLKEITSNHSNIFVSSNTFDALLFSGTFLYPAAKVCLEPN